MYVMKWEAIYHVSFDQFQVRVADTSVGDPNQGFARTRRGAVHDNQLAFTTAINLICLRKATTDEQTYKNNKTYYSLPQGERLRTVVEKHLQCQYLPAFRLFQC